ncbi:MAG TPA: TonB-dependent receptor [Sphingobacteriaceae bacterium]
MMNKRSIAVVAFLLVHVAGWAQEKVNLKGIVKDAATGEALIGATVIEQQSHTGTSTKVDGSFQLALQKGQIVLVVKYLGYKTGMLRLNLQTDWFADIVLETEAGALNEVVVSDLKKNENVMRSDVSLEKLNQATIKAMPALLGEVDVIRSVQMLPGVISPGEGATGFSVRGGGIDQNLILLDGAPIYNSSHLMGMFSVFNPDVVKEVTLLKGGFPAQYGGRLSSILDVTTKPGDLKSPSVSGGIGLISARLAAEVPFVEDKGSVKIAGRRTYGDRFIKFSEDQKPGENQLYFYDLTGRADYIINAKNRLAFSAYASTDVFSFDEKLALDYKNQLFSLQYSRFFSDNFRSKLEAFSSKYKYTAGVPSGPEAFELESDIHNIGSNLTFNYYAGNNTLTFGGSALYYKFGLGKITPGDGSFFIQRNIPDRFSFEAGAFVNHEWNINERLLLNYGLRVSAYDYLGKQTIYDYVGETGKRKEAVNPRGYSKGQSVKRYFNAEPRVNARYSLDDESSIKFSYGRISQYVHLVSNSNASSPFDIWLPTTEYVKPELSDQFVLGYFKNLRNNTYELGLEAFYKKLYNQVDYIDNADLVLNTNIEAELLFGDGRSYGLEFSGKKSAGKLTGIVGYTLAKTERKIEGINNGRYYPGKYDKIHNLNFMANVELNNRWSMSANFVYGTGMATTLPDGKFEWDGLIVPVSSDNGRNNFRLPDNHRLDLSATRKGTIRPGKRFRSEWVFSVYNLYSRKNAFSLFLRQNEDQPQKSEAIKLSVFGFMLPSVTYNFKF